ncbi:hypothetical protein GCM10009117_07640 [Gangjinia marincola]|uniref:SnoaL-like domain-containing protein n=1 Tax=Gangjinia marincola TaxID=578463 RepID=A0ABN1MES4_9FLAO
MNRILLLLLSITVLIGCKSDVNNTIEMKTFKKMNFEQEKTAILETLNNETRDAFQRDYEKWTENWVHTPNISKTYMNFVDSTFSESIGWDEISQFVKTFIEEHPEPEPVPKLIDDIDVRLYGDGASVSFKQMDSIRGLKRKTRLMEKENGKWKIAGMHTTIYGFKSQKQ